MRTLACLVPLMFLGVGCGAPDVDQPTEDTGFLLVGGDALARAPTLDDGTPVSVLPVEVGADRWLVVGGALVDARSHDGLLVYAHGTDGASDTLVLGADIYDDRFTVRATTGGAARFAAEIDATIEPSGDDRWLVRADDIWARAASADPATAPTEVIPIELGSSTTGGAGQLGATVTGTGASVGIGPGAGAAEPIALQLNPETAPGTVSCEDPITGVWVGSNHIDEGNWRQMTLTIARDGKGLRGTIANRGWAGDADQDQPVVGDAGGLNGFDVLMAATGPSDPARFDFQARSITHREGDGYYMGRPYELDHITGTIEGNEIHAVQNDGKWAFDRPFTFRHVACR